MKQCTDVGGASGCRLLTRVGAVLEASNWLGLARPNGTLSESFRLRPAANFRFVCFTRFHRLHWALSTTIEISSDFSTCGGSWVRDYDHSMKRAERKAPCRTAHVSEVLPLRKNSMAVDVLLILFGPDTVAPSISVADLQVLSPLFEHR